MPAEPHTPGAAPPAAPDDLAGVVVHAPEGDPHRLAALVRNLGNLRPALAARTALELVAHGPGLTVLRRDGVLAAEVSKIDGVTLVACANTMARLGVDEAELLPGVVVVPAGIAHVVQRQAEGWAYVRP